MRRILGCLLLFLCCAAGGETAEKTLDPRLVKARTILEEAVKNRTAGDYAKARAQVESALALRTAVLGERHPDVAKCLSALGDLYRQQGNLVHAESLLKRALDIQKATLGENHTDVARALTRLGIVYADKCLFDKAAKLFRQALVIWAAAPGMNQAQIADELNNIANIHDIQGLYDQAEPLYKRALELRKDALGEMSPEAAQSLDNLANLYSSQGFDDRAIPLHERAVEILKSTLGENHSLLAAPLNNLAILYSKLGSYGQAEPLYQRAIAISERTLGKNHPNTALLLNNLADLYIQRGLYDRAEPLLQRALTIQENALGENHPNTALSLNNLGKLYWIQGSYSQAEPLLQRALAIQEKTLITSHPAFGGTLADLARLRLAQHRLAGAVPLFTRAFNLSERRLRQEALDFSESRLSNFLHSLRASEETLYALLRAYPEDIQVQHLALSAVLLLKGRSVEETANISRTVYRSLGSEDQERFEQLRGLRTRFATLSFSDPSSPSKEYQALLHSVGDEGDALEATLAQRSAPLRALTGLPRPTVIVERIAHSLPKESALVEFIAYMDSPLVPKPGTPPSQVPAQLRYLALVLFPNGDIRVADLGPAEDIDTLVAGLLNELSRPSHDASVRVKGQALYQRVFQPLLPLLGSTRRLFVSPDGKLSLIPFATLHDGQDFLLDSFDFTYLTSGRDLLPRPQDIPAASSVVVFADPDFAASPLALAPTPGPRSTPSARSAGLSRFYSNARQALSINGWQALPGTRTEAENIQHRLPQAKLFLGLEATKTRLLQLPPPGILHLATHGFFLGDAHPLVYSRSPFVIPSMRGLSVQQEPLLNSGLVLAGAATAASDSSVSLDASLVTALELAGLDLWGTQLVVLSACDTGRGEVQPGQGVSGLRRALVVAGAETVVMSLWTVSDDSTRLLMNTYYRNLLDGQGRASALREAMRELRASHPHPHDWAPFIALGSDAPLRGISPSSPQAPNPPGGP